MVPSTIQSNLASLRRRERLLTLVWGAACWLAIVLTLLLICSLIDWLIDRQRETPMGVRLGFFSIQAAVAALAGFVFVLWPQIRRLPDTLMALWVEEKIPEFEHRLISAVQLNQPDAQLDGMSKELVTVVTREAETQAQRVGGFAQIADHRRLKWTASVLTPILVVAAIPLVLWPDVAFALLARQVLLDKDVPHSVTLESASPSAWLIGEEIPIRFRVTGNFSEEMVGDLYVRPEGQPRDHYPLKFITKDERGAIFGADVHPSSANIYYSARLRDGRTKASYEMKLVSRPIITENLAWVQLPAYSGLRPARDGWTIDDRRYERPQGRGDVVGITGSTVRVQVRVQKEIAEGEIELLRTKQSAEGSPPALEEPTGVRVKMVVDSDGVSAEARFDLAEGLTGYRVHVKDEHGFENNPAPRRSLRMVPEEGPQVALLRDTFGFGEGSSFDLEGLPVPLGERIRVPYSAFGAYGLGKAQILYRVLKKVESGNEPIEEDKWIRLPLSEEVSGTNTGPFDMKNGVFVNTPFDRAVQFHAIPSPNPDSILGRTQGGGRIFLETNGLIDSKGNILKLKTGDQVEYCVEVYAPHRDPAASTPYARSETRVSTVLDQDGFDTWINSVSKEDERVRLLKAKQEGIFGSR